MAIILHQSSPLTNLAKVAILHPILRHRWPEVQVGRGGVAVMSLDDLDLQIIRLLQEDGRRPNTAVARHLRLPEATVRRRIDRLIRGEVIRIVAVADGAKLGLPLHVLIGLQIDLTKAEDIGAALCRLAEVRWVGATAGPQDFILEAFFHSTPHLHDFLTKTLAKIPGVLRTQTSTVLHLQKNAYRWDVLIEAGAGDRAGAPPPGAATGARSSRAE